MKSENKTKDYSYKICLFFLIFPVAFFISCSLSAFMDYDKIFDSYSTELAKKYELFFIQMDRSFGTHEKSYEKTNDFYDGIHSVIGVLLLREEARGSKKEVVEALTALTQYTRELEELHKKNQLTKDNLNEIHGKVRKELLTLVTEERDRLFEEAKIRKEKKAKRD